MVRFGCGHQEQLRFGRSPYAPPRSAPARPAGTRCVLCTTGNAAEIPRADQTIRSPSIELISRRAEDPTDDPNNPGNLLPKDDQPHAPQDFASNRRLRYLAPCLPTKPPAPNEPKFHPCFNWPSRSSPGRPIRLCSQDRCPHRQSHRSNTTTPWCPDALPAMPPVSNRRGTRTAKCLTCSEILHTRTSPPFMFAGNINEEPPHQRPISSRTP